MEKYIDIKKYALSSAIHTLFCLANDKKLIY